MTIFAAALAASLSRADIIERFKSPPITKVEGLVRVFADCPADMRSEFQSPIAGFAAGVCKDLYGAIKEKPRRFEEPGIVLHIGDIRTNTTEIVVRESTRADGSRFTRIYLLAPGYADLAKLRVELAKAFMLAVKGEVVDDKTAERAVRDANRELRTEFKYAEIDRWMRGEAVEGSDEDMLRLCRSVLEPGVARQSDILRFASRLYLYPPFYNRPFCGKYLSCDFAQALELAEDDPLVRFMALSKSSQVVLFGGGRGDELYEAAKAYSDFLIEVAQWKKSKKELRDMLDAADLKLNVAMESARKREEEASL